MANATDPEQLTGEVLRLGTIASVDHGNATCTVEAGDIVTGELPWVAQRAGNVRTWSPPSIGEQCLLVCPEGDLEAGLVLVGLYSDECPPPSSSADLHLIAYPDGAQISYDHAAHRLVAVLPAGGSAEIAADGGIAVIGDVTITGNVSVSGKVAAQEDVLAGTISLKSHKHGNVAAGGAKTGGPE